MFEIQKFGDKTSSGEIGLDIGTSPKVGENGPKWLIEIDTLHVNFLDGEQSL